MNAAIDAIGLGPYLFVSAALLVLGVFGIFLNRKNIIVMLMAMELILLSANLNLVAFSSALGDLSGQVMVLFVLTIAAAEAAIGLAIVTVYFRNRGSIQVEDVTMMKAERPCTLISTCFPWLFWPPWPEQWWRGLADG